MLPESGVPCTCRTAKRQPSPPISPRDASPSAECSTVRRYPQAQFPPRLKFSYYFLIHENSVRDGAARRERAQAERCAAARYPARRRAAAGHRGRGHGKDARHYGAHPASPAFESKSLRRKYPRADVHEKSCWRDESASRQDRRRARKSRNARDVSLLLRDAAERYRPSARAAGEGGSLDPVAAESWPTEARQIPAARGAR